MRPCNLLSVQRDEDRDKFTAAVTLGERAGSVKDLINLAQNLDCYWLYKVYKGQESIDLTPREFEILRELLTHKGRILTRQNLLQTLWKYEFFGEERIIDTHIKNLRKKLGTADYIETIRGVGYRIDKEN